jgi:hypothetical protein
VLVPTARPAVMSADSVDSTEMGKPNEHCPGQRYVERKARRNQAFLPIDRLTQVTRSLNLVQRPGRASRAGILSGAMILPMRRRCSVPPNQLSTFKLN